MATATANGINRRWSGRARKGATENDLTFTSTKVFFTVQKEGALPPLDRIPPVCQAR